LYYFFVAVLYLAITIFSEVTAVAKYPKRRMISIIDIKSGLQVARNTCCRDKNNWFLVA